MAFIIITKKSPVPYFQMPPERVKPPSLRITVLRYSLPNSLILSLRPLSISSMEGKDLEVHLSLSRFSCVHEGYTSLWAST